jgi:hypothetical protein
LESEVVVMSEAETMPEIYDREEMAAAQAADINYKPTLPADAPSAESGRAQVGAGSHPPSPPAAPADDTPLPVEPTPPAPPKRMSLAEINDQARASIPSHWLKGPPEPWRPYLHWYI